MGNNRDLPTYDKSVGIQVVDQPDPMGTASAMISAFRDFSGAIGDVANKVASDEAAEQRATLKNNISSTYRGFSLTALQNPDQNAALAGYNESSQKYAKGIIADTPSYNRAYAQNMIDYYHNEQMYPIQKNAIMQNQRSLSVQAYQDVNDSSRDILDAINNSKPIVDQDGKDHQFDAAYTLIADQMRNMQSYATNKFITPEALGKGRDELIKKYTSAIYLKRYEDQVQAGRGNEFIKEIGDPQYHIPQMSDQDKYNIVGEMIKIRDQGKSGARAALGQLQYDMRDNLINVKNGGRNNVDLEQQVNDLDPVRGKEYSDQIGIAKSTYAATQAARYKTPAERSQLKSSLLNIDYNQPDAALKRRTADSAIQAIDKQEKDLQDNPIAYVMKNPAIANAVNNYEQAFNADATGKQMTYTPFNSTVQKPWNTIINEQMHLGLTLNGSNGNSVKMIDTALVPQMVNTVMQAAPKDKLVMMNKLNDEYGGGLPFNLALRQMVNAGMPKSYGLMATINPNSPDAETVANALSIPANQITNELKKTNPKGVEYIANQAQMHVYNPDMGASNNFKSFIGTMQKYGDSADVSFRNDMAATITQLANYYSLTQSMSPDQSIKKAEDIFADRYTYMSLDSNPIRLPNGVNESSVRNYAMKMEGKLQDFPFNFQGTDESRAARVIKYGHWQNDSVDNGLVWVDANGMLWKDKNGHPFGFSFDEADTGVAEPRTPYASMAQSPNVQQQVETSTTTQPDSIDMAGQKLMQKGQAEGQKFRQIMQQAGSK